MESATGSQRLILLEARVDRLESLLTSFREETRQRFDAVNQRLETMDQRLSGLAVDMNQRFDDVGRRISILHEDVIARIAMMGEGRSARDRRRKPKS